MRQRIGRYEILEAIASGGFATVYRARDSQLGRVVALKVLHPHMTSDPQYVERFLREARMAASINHPNVVVIHAVGQEGDTHFIAMEYLPSSLESLLQQGKLPVAQALSIARQVALALEAAHQRGIIHRDLKPQNILLTAEGTPRVSDFGIARAAELSTMTASGMVLGTPHYMSPEQAQGRQVDARSDIYSLGCVLYQMLTGALPFEATTSWEVIRQHIEVAPRRVGQLRPEVPAAVEQLVSRCLEKQPGRRYQTAGAGGRVCPAEGWGWGGSSLRANAGGRKGWGRWCGTKGEDPGWPRLVVAGWAGRGVVGGCGSTGGAGSAVVGTSGAAQG